MAKKPRDYKKEYREFHAKPIEKKRRAARNAAHNKLDPPPGKEVDHKNRNPGGKLSNDPKNLRVVDRKTNRKRKRK